MTATAEQVRYINSPECRELTEKIDMLYRFAMDARFFGYDDMAEKALADMRELKDELVSNGWFDIYDEDIPF